MCKISDIIVLLLLLTCSVWDVWTKKIPTKFLVGMTAVIVFLWLLSVNKTMISVLSGITIGVFFWLVSKITREAIGFGDSWIILLLGMYLGGRKLLALVMIAFFLAGVVSLAGLIRKKWNRTCSIPFVPFLTAAYAGVVFL